MFNFKQLILHNFGSYGHAEIDLSNRGFCLVSGINKFKKDNAISNGAGKSFLWSAICFALTGETIQGLRTNLKNINIDDDSCYVNLFFDVNSDKFELTRYISPKADLKILKNSIDISGKGIRESEKRLAEVLPDITKDLISSTIIIGQGLPNRFSSFSPSGRKELLEKLTKADFMIDDIKTRVAGRLQELSSKLREYEDSLLIHRTKLADLERQLAQTSKELTDLSVANYDLEIINTTSAVARNDSSLAEMAKDIASYEAVIDGLNVRLLELMNQKNEDEQDELKAYNDATIKVITEKSQLIASIKALEAEILKLANIKDICPTCGQKIPGVIKPNTAVQQEALTEQKAYLAELDKKLTEYNTLHNSYSKQIREAYASDMETINGKLRESKQALAKLKDKQVELTQANKQANERLTQLKYYKQTAEQRLKTLQVSIVDLQEAIRVTTNSIKLIEVSKAELDEHQAVLKKMENLIKRDFRGFLLLNIIAYIDKRAKDFCEIVFGTRELSVYLDGNALDIAYCGKMFDNLSGGEKQRVDLILQFAIRDMLSVYLDINANILVLDEITDFLDKKSCSAVMNLVSKELSSVESVFIVSHHASELDLPIDSEITIVKNENGISEVV